MKTKTEPKQVPLLRSVLDFSGFNSSVSARFSDSGYAVMRSTVILLHRISSTVWQGGNSEESA